MAATRTYHHGDLPRVLLGTAADLVAEDGPTTWSLREVARRAGVSHAAPAHHFGDKAGLLRALATEGFTLLGAALAAADSSPSEPLLNRFRASANAYVQFAVTHRGHFDVMFRCDAFEPDDEFLLASIASYEALRSLVVELLGPTADEGEIDEVTLTCWSLVHGLSTLHNQGMLGSWGPGATRTVEDATNAVIGVLLDGMSGRRSVDRQSG